MTPTLVLNVVGLTPSLLQHAPNLQALARNGAVRPLTTVLPAVTTTVQSTMLTGLPPRDHGIVGNGWYFRDLSEIWLWRQSNRLVGGEKVWEAAKRRDPAFTCAKLFWWYNMYSSADIAVTPRPMYLADGRKLPDIYTHPAELRDELQSALGEFPLFRFWGPGADIESSRWIARSALHVLEQRRPTLTLVYLPHLDYDLQRFGPNHPSIPAQVAAVDALCGPLIEKARAFGAHVVVLSEYGITAVSRPPGASQYLADEGVDGRFPSALSRRTAVGKPPFPTRVPESGMRPRPLPRDRRHGDRLNRRTNQAQKSAGGEPALKLSVSAIGALRSRWCRDLDRD